MDTNTGAAMKRENELQNSRVEAESASVRANRRKFIKAAVGVGVTSSAMFTATAVLAEDEFEPLPEPEPRPPSPDTIPWADYLPDYVTPLPSTTLYPAPTLKANLVANEAGRLPHQKWNEVINQYGYGGYELFAVQLDNWVFNPAYPPQPHWGYQGSPINNDMPEMPSVLIHARYGYPIICRIHNKLPLTHHGFGVPEISTHLHNLHAASESDGFPGDYYSEALKGPTLTAPGSFKDHLYINLKAGFAQSTDGFGDPTEALGTLFYHDHTDNFTAANVYRGLSGFYLLFDELDTGNENDSSATALRLPSGEYDYPLSLGDRCFDETGMLFFDQLNPDGVIGDKIAINGKIEPCWRVASRKYRIRILNSGPSRIYDLAILDNRNKFKPFTYIANDGNLLPAPLLNQTSVYLAPAERADIIVDFSGYKLGTELYLVNRLKQTTTRKPDGIVTPGDKIMKIIIDRKPRGKDKSRVPDKLRPLPSITPAEIASAPVRQFVFARNGGVWTINDKIFDIHNPVAKINMDSYEIWELINPSGGWTHPIHIHLEECQILNLIVNGIEKTIPAHLKGRKDVFVLEPYTTMKVFIRFRDFTGKYVMHCHNLIHEDHVMMTRWDVV
ncbi:multicopper oxidase domain-containing protein [Shewanella sp. A25]|nr:multicopper oxidase domain-containing protein [Shewanella shenzhenensis]